MAGKTIVYRFTGARAADGSPKEWYPGIPARDLDERDVERLTRRDLIATVKALNIYEAVTPDDDDPATPKTRKAKAEAEPAPSGDPKEA